MNITESYKKRPVFEDKYDAICIGSGLGSLTTANLLSKHGQKVLVLEKHYTAGGFTHVFSRPEYEWDVGVHYVGEVHKPNTMMHKLFKYLSNNQIKWEDMGEVYDQIVFGDKVFDFVKGTSNFKAKLKEYFPNESSGIDKYFEYVFEVNKASRTYFAEKVLPDTLRYFTSNLLRKKYIKFAEQTTLEVIEKCTQNKELIGVLTGQFGDYGLPPSKSSFAMHAAVAKHYFTNGGAYPVGGSIRFLETLSQDIIKAGGKIVTNAHVTGLEIENNKVVGVIMKDGKKLFAENVISGIGIVNSLQQLIPSEFINKFPITKFNAVPSSIGHVSLYIGLKESSKDLNLPRANQWLFPSNYNHDENVENYLNDPENQPFPVCYISFPSSKDPDFENRFPNKSTIEIISLAPYEWFAKWEGTRWKKRGEEYETWKENMSQRLLKRLFDRLPHLEGKIDYYELSTPLTTKHFANYASGEIYGLDHTPERFKLKSLRPKTPLKNFYLTGQDILSAGVGGAAFSGVLTTTSILKKNIIKDLLKVK